MTPYDYAVSSGDLDGGEYVPERVTCNDCGQELDAADEPVGRCAECRRERAEFEDNNANDPRR